MKDELTEKAERFERIKARFEEDSFAIKMLGIKIDDADIGYAKCSLKLRPELLNIGGFAMGGVLFTLADITFAIASNCERGGTVTLSSQMYFLKNVSEGTVYAEAKAIRQGNKIGVYEINIFDESGIKIAYTICEGFTLE